MRAYAALLIIALVTAFLAGSLSLSVRRMPESERRAPPAPVALRARFLEGRAPIASFDLAKLYPLGDATELIDPRTVLPRTSLYPPEQMLALYQYARTCQPSAASEVVDPRLAKARLWHEMRCRDSANSPDAQAGLPKPHQGRPPRPIGLPDRFFLDGPPLHPSGRSYAALAAESSVAGSRPAHRFHLGELEAFHPPPLELDRRVLLALERSALEALAEGEAIVLSGTRVFLRNLDQAAAAGAGRYSGYPRAEWDTFLAGQGLAVVDSRDDEACLLREARLCWRPDTAPERKRLNRSALFLTLGALATTVGLTALLLVRLRSRRKEQEQQRFVLQTLTHELRTPIAGLLVSVEALQRDYDLLPPRAQDEVLRLLGGAHRLHRLAETSRRYLGAGRTRLELEFEETAVADLIAEVIAPHAEKVEVQLFLQHERVPLDAYWVALCLRNLVENALTHGVPPVRVEVHGRQHEMELLVIDQGRESFDDTRKRSGRGLGVGLSLVRKVVSELKGTLTVSFAPTRFSLKLPVRQRP